MLLLAKYRQREKNPNPATGKLINFNKYKLLENESEDESEEEEEEELNSLSKDIRDQRLEEQMKLKRRYHKLRLEINSGSLESQDLSNKKVESYKKISTLWNSIIDKYSHFDEDDQGDVINLNSFNIELNTGHIAKLNDSYRTNIWNDEHLYTDDKFDGDHCDPSLDPINLITPAKSRSVSRNVSRPPERLGSYDHYSPLKRRKTMPMVSSNLIPTSPLSHKRTDSLRKPSNHLFLDQSSNPFKNQFPRFPDTISNTPSHASWHSSSYFPSNTSLNTSPNTSSNTTVRNSTLLPKKTPRVTTEVDPLMLLTPMSSKKPVMNHMPKPVPYSLLPSPSLSSEHVPTRITNNFIEPQVPHLDLLNFDSLRRNFNFTETYTPPKPKPAVHTSSPPHIDLFKFMRKSPILETSTISTTINADHSNSDSRNTSDLQNPFLDRKSIETNIDNDIIEISDSEDIEMKVDNELPKEKIVIDLTHDPINLLTPKKTARIPEVNLSDDPINLLMSSKKKLSY